jgi:hypothetical protein
MAQPDPAAVPPRGELEPREGVDGHRVRLDSVHVAEDDACAAPLEQRAHALGQAGEVGARDRPADREHDGLQRCSAHRE